MKDCINVYKREESYIHIPHKNWVLALFEFNTILLGSRGIQTKAQDD